MKIIPIDEANKSQCFKMIDYFLSVNATEAVIKYSNRLYEICDFEQKFMSQR